MVLLYQTHFQTQLSRSQFLVLEIILNLLGAEKQVRLERLARVFPYPITTESRRRKLKRFLDLPQLTIIRNKLSLYGSCQEGLRRCLKEILIQTSLSIGERCNN